MDNTTAASPSKMDSLVLSKHLASERQEPPQLQIAKSSTLSLGSIPEPEHPKPVGLGASLSCMFYSHEDDQELREKYNEVEQRIN